MINGYRFARHTLLAILGIATLLLSLTIKEFGIYFGVLLLVGAATSAVYVFMHFDKQINEKLIIEMIIDGFTGLIIFTYPEPTDRFFMLDFSFWIAIMGVLYIVSGLFDNRNSNRLWLYLLSGITMIVLGFIILNYSTEYIGSVSYLIGFILTYYSLLGIYLLNKKLTKSL
jgi:uncharacterized membrane protein HdeD (DUF308 family)